MHLEIVTPEEQVFSGEIELLKVPGTKGSFEVLRNHAPIISTLDSGQIMARDPKGKIMYFEIQGGVIEVKSNHIIVLAEV